MDRVDRPRWAALRHTLSSWYLDYPATDAKDLARRFQSPSPDQHLAAWWELYLHRLFRCLGYEIEVHPELADVPGRPDFRVRRDGFSMLVEAATTFSGVVDEQQDARRQAAILDAVDEGQSSDFNVGLEIEKTGHEQPAVRDIVPWLEAWLASLDADDVMAADPTHFPERTLEVRGWRLAFTALPIGPEHRGKPGRLLGMPPSVSGFVNDVEQLSKTLERKRKGYGQPDEPLIIAVLLTSTFFDNIDVEKALMGPAAVEYYAGERGGERWIRQRNGLWIRPDGPRAMHISGVLTGSQILPWTHSAHWPRFWPNPWAERPITEQWPFPRGTAAPDGSFDYTEADCEPGTILNT
ncbi:MAG: hypothetical protein JWQ20_1915 [Conexibacter sp.]|nr:hypothetical protein [Conexibacter sp.]